MMELRGTPKRDGFFPRERDEEGAEPEYLVCFRPRAQDSMLEVVNRFSRGTCVGVASKVG